ncbi:2292_t:CDS:1, partial [Racocetra persica]
VLNIASSTLQLYDMDSITYSNISCNAFLVSQSDNTSLISNTYFAISNNISLVKNSSSAYNNSIFSNSYNIDHFFKIKSFSNVDNNIYLNNKYLTKEADEYDKYKDQENKLASLRL